MKLSTLIFLGIAIVGPLTTQPIRAAISNSLVLIENSSTDLDGTYTLANGTTETVNITLRSADNWTVTVSTASFSSFLVLAWEEPESNLANLINSGASINTLNVFSDISGVEIMHNPDGTPLLCGTDTGNNAIINVSFFDHSDVPDTGSSFGLLFLALIVLMGATRLRSLRLA